MGKINCDVCGTAYPESATQCPICGCVRSTERTVSAESEDTSSRNGNYTYVKGGRFSKANVRKRNQGTPMQDVPQFREADSDEVPEGNSKTDRGLVAAVCVLLLAIVAVVIYIVTRFFAPDASTENGDMNVVPPITTEPSTVITLPPETTEETEVPTTVETVPPTVEETEPETEPVVNNYYVKPYKTNKDDQGNDATIYKSNTFQLKMTDATGELMDVDWLVEDPSICSVEGNTVKGLKRGTTKVYVVIDGETYFCIVRVK